MSMQPPPQDFGEGTYVGAERSEPDVEVDVIMIARSVDEIRAELGDHAAAIEALVEHWEQLTANPPRSQPSPYAWTHADATQRWQLWLALAQWVGWHNTHYGATSLRIPACWYQHPTAVVELTALMEAWRVAYLGHREPTLDAAQYLQHYLHPIMQRLQQENWGFRNCSGSRHELKISDQVAPFNPADDAFTAFVDAEVVASATQDAVIDPSAAPSEEPPDLEGGDAREMF